jgi:hypothetical protein
VNSFNITVKAKLFATLALAGIVMVAVGVLGLSGTKSSNGHLDALFYNRFEPTGWVGAIESHEREVLEKAEDAVIRQDAGGVKVAVGLLADRRDKVQELIRKLEATELTDKERALVMEFSGHGNDVISFLQEALLAAQSGTFDRACWSCRSKSDNRCAWMPRRRSSATAQSSSAPSRSGSAWPVC